ncbi:hypothetical protein EMPG_11776 [Blastomyces silverae]|uniref:Uncharacterized protein n=1 Tax=Blastomyces silverae TaxID=2060906 RepID=A0A0H1BPJ1_9EURO|nr:hypothetical protein EMPG_11776 [Blastomyces silverae]
MSGSDQTKGASTTLLPDHFSKQIYILTKDHFFEDIPDEKKPNHFEAMNQVSYKATAEKWVSDMLHGMEGRHPDSKQEREAPPFKYESNVDINAGNKDEAEEPRETNEATGETHNTVLPNRKTKITGPADGGRRPWSAAHEKELKSCLLEYRKCPAEWDENGPRFANMLKLMEQKEAHDEFARRRSFHEINEGWMYRSITSQRIKARRAMPMGFYHSVSS